MKKKIILSTFILIISFIIFNYKIFLWNYYYFNANSDYLDNNFSWALQWYNNSLTYLSWSKIDFNKWNTYYKIWENEQDINKKIDNYKESLNLYSNILENDLNNNKQEASDVRYNYEFVKKKLEELEQQEESQKDEDKKQEESNQDNDKTEQEQNETEKNEEGETRQEKSEQDGEMPKIELSPEEFKQIENYIENLKKEEKYNREYLNNIKPIENNSIFDSIFDRWWEKDW